MFYIDRIKSQAGSDCLLAELEKYKQHRSGLKREFVSRCVEDIVEAIIPKCQAFEPIAYERLSQMKGLDKSTGYPTQKFFGRYIDVCQEVARHNGISIDPEQDIRDAVAVPLGEIVEMYEKHIRNGGKPGVYYTASPKTDYHSISKLSNGRLRSLCGPHWLDLLLQVRYSKDFVETFEHRSTTAFCINTCEKFTRHFAAKHRKLFSCGLDATGFDKTVPIDVLELVLHAIFTKSGLDPSVPSDLVMIEFLVDSVVRAPIFIPSVGTMMREGGMPSGSYLTSVVNTICLQVMVQAYKRMHDVEFLFTNCSDDAVVSFESLEQYQLHFKPLVDCLTSEFGLNMKIDLFDDNGVLGPYGPGYVPSFLSKTVSADPVNPSLEVIVATDLTRTCASIAFIPVDAPLRVQQITGVLESIAGNLYLRHRGLTCPMLEAIVADAENAGVDVDSVVSQAYVTHAVYWDGDLGVFRHC